MPWRWRLFLSCQRGCGQGPHLKQITLGVPPRLGFRITHLFIGSLSSWHHDFVPNGGMAACGSRPCRSRPLPDRRLKARPCHDRVVCRVRVVLLHNRGKSFRHLFRLPRDDSDTRQAPPSELTGYRLLEPLRGQAVAAMSLLARVTGRPFVSVHTHGEDDD